MVHPHSHEAHVDHSADQVRALREAGGLPLSGGRSLFLTCGPKFHLDSLSFPLEQSH
jgi:hypothetical protein